MKTTGSVIATVLSLSLLTGCSAFRANITEKDPATAGALSAQYDQQDLLSLADLITKDIFAHPFPKETEKEPILADLGIQNRTKSHLDMKALSDTISTKMLDTGKVRFVNTARRDDLMKEQGFQLQNATAESRAQIGRQLGAKYMLTGSLTEIEKSSGKQVRASKQTDIYYQLTLELTDLETGLIVVRKQRDRLRRASKPIIGW